MHLAIQAKKFMQSNMQTGKLHSTYSWVQKGGSDGTLEW